MIASCLALLTCAAPSFPPEDDPADGLLEGLPERWEAAMEDLRVPGLAVVVVLDDRVALLRGFGRRDVETGRPVTPDTAFYIASATKPYVALALRALADEGKLDLDRPVREVLPRFRLADPEATARITVRDLLCHAPGLHHGMIVLLDAYTGEITEDRYYHYLAEVEPAGAPAYSNVHFTLAGRVIEAVTGRGWRDELAERLFAPAGMTATTGYADEMYAREDVAYPTVWGATGFVHASVRKDDSTMHAAGGLGTSARDAGRWLRLNLNHGELEGEEFLSAEGALDLLTPQSSSTGGGPLFQATGFGLGWQVSSFQGHTVLQHGGGYVGTASFFSFVPELGIGVAALANTDTGGNVLCSVVVRDVYEALMGDTQEDYLSRIVAQLSARWARESAADEEAMAAVELSLAEDAYAGAYTNELWGTLHVAFEEGRLQAHLGRYELEPRPLRPDRFHVDAGIFSAEFLFDLDAGRARSVTATLEGDGATRAVVFAR